MKAPIALMLTLLIPTTAAADSFCRSGSCRSFFKPVKERLVERDRVVVINNVIPTPIDYRLSIRDQSNLVFGSSDYSGGLNDYLTLDPSVNQRIQIETANRMVDSATSLLHKSQQSINYERQYKADAAAQLTSAELVRQIKKLIQSSQEGRVTLRVEQDEGLPPNTLPLEQSALNKCANCHSGDKPKAGFDITGDLTLDQLNKARSKVEAGEMPPDSEGVDRAAARELYDLWLEHR